MSESTILGPNPSGLCMCGCGGEAPLARANDVRYGIIKGLPQRYIRGHQKFKSFTPYLVDADTCCWVWQRAVNSSGYGHLYVDGVHKYAHIHAYEQVHGAIENSGRTTGSQQVHHKCGNKLCVNPDHLELIGVHDHRESHGIYQHEDKISGVREMFSAGMSRKDIAAMSGVSYSHVCGVLRGDFWRNIA